MANIPMKTLRLHGLDDTYTIPTAPEHIGAAPDSIFPKQAKGSLISVDDSGDAPLHGLKLFGKTTQKTTTGKNLLKNTAVTPAEPSKGIQFTVNDDGSITANGTSTGDTLLYVVENYELPAGKYIISGLSVGSTDTFFFGVIDHTNNGVYRQFVNPIHIEFATPTKISAWMQVKSGQTVSNLTCYPMIRLASITGNTYEPYTGGIPSPNPDYPQELVNAGADGSIDVTVCGKNLLVYPYDNKSFISGTVQFDANDDGSILVKSENTTAWATYRIHIDLRLPVGNFRMVSNCSPALQYSIAEHERSSGAYVRSIGTVFSTSDWDYDKYQYRCVLQVKNANTTINETVYPMICLASETDTTFEPYKDGGTLTAQTSNGLPGIPVSSGGNYTDENGQRWICDEIDFARGKYVQRVYKEIFTKDRTYAVQNAYMVRGYPAKRAVEGGAVMCTHFVGNGDSKSTVILGWRGEQIYFGQFASVDDFKTAIGDEEIAVLYELAEPIETDLSAEEMAQYHALHTNKPNTTIYNDAGADMEVSYFTPNAAVPMNVGSGANGKVLGIDEHGCVVPRNAFAIESTEYPGCYYRLVDGEKEWVNPPFSFGTEYRTTERIDGKVVYKKKDGSGAIKYRLDGESTFKPYATAVGGLPLDGSAQMTGAIQFKDNASISYTTSNITLTAKQDGETRRNLMLNHPGFMELKESLRVTENIGVSSTTYAIFGEHNKPSGSYTGNGSAAERTFDIGGIGRILVVTSASRFCFVYHYGAVYFNDTGAVEAFTFDEVKFTNGVLTLNTTSDGFNKSGSVYLYYLL